MEVRRFVLAKVRGVHDAGQAWVMRTAPLLAAKVEHLLRLRRQAGRLGAEMAAVAAVPSPLAPGVNPFTLPKEAACYTTISGTHPASSTEPGA